MQITGIYNTPYIFRKMPDYVSFAGKKQPKKQVDTFEKQKEPYSVDNSIDDFAKNLADLMAQNKYDKNNLKQLVRQYVPRTKIEDNSLKLFLDGNAAQFLYRTQISNNKKMHYFRKKIVINLDKNENEPNALFNEFVHEMIHNLQVNKERKIFNTIYNDFFDDSFPAHKSFNNLFYAGVVHGSQMIIENFNDTFGVIKFFEKQDYKKEKNKNVDIWVVNPEKRNVLEQVYDLGVLNILSKEEEAYTTADSLEYKYFNTKNPRAKKNERLFKALKEIVVDDLKKTGMSEEKMAEYKELIGW